VNLSLGNDPEGIKYQWPWVQPTDDVAEAFQP